MTIKHWIGGREVESRETFTTLNPATGEVITDVASGGEAEVDVRWRVGAVPHGFDEVAIRVGGVLIDGGEERAGARVAVPVHRVAESHRVR